MYAHPLVDWLNSKLNMEKHYTILIDEGQGDKVAKAIRNLKENP